MTTIEQVSGQSINSVSRILQDDNGYFWLASKSGLMRFDGYQLKTFAKDKKNPNSLIDNFILDFVLDGKFLWIATINGLSRFNIETEQFIHFTHLEDDLNSLSNNAVYAISLGSDNALWLATQEGINHLDRQTLKVTRSGPHLPELASTGQQRIAEVFEDNKQRLWFSDAERGLFSFDRNSGQLKHFSKNAQDPTQLDRNRILAIYQSRDNTVWIGSYASLLRFDEKHQHFKRYAVERRGSNVRVDKNILITNLFEDSSGRIWLSSLFNGVSYLDLDTDKVININQSNNNPNAFNTNTITDVTEAADGSLWFVALNKGLIRIAKNNFDKLHFETRTETVESIVGLTADGNDVWFAQGKNLYRLNTLTNEITTEISDLGFITTVGKASDGNLYFNLLDHGMYRFDKLSKQYQKVHFSTLTNAQIVDFKFDNTGGLWLGMYRTSAKSGGVVKINVDTGETLYETSNLNVTAIAQTSRGMLFSSREEGLLLITEVDGKFIEKRSPPGRINLISDLHKDESGRVWLTSNTSGLGLVDLTTLNVNYLDDLPGNFVDAPVEDDNGWLWIDSNAGLLAYHPDTKALNSFSDKDGLYFTGNTALDSVKLANGELVFAKTSNLIRFLPSKLLRAQKTKDNKVMLTDFKLLNQPVALRGSDPDSPLNKVIEYTDSLTLSYQDYLFSLNLSSTGLMEKTESKFAYRLLGYRDDWIETDSRTPVITYTSLPANQYQLQVKTTDSQGNWSKQIRRLDITITPPWYLTTTAYIVYIVSLIGAIYLFIRYRTQRLTQQAKVLENTVQLRTKELQSSRDQVTQLLAQKERSFANISHEFKTPLTLVLTPIEAMLNTPKARFSLDKCFDNLEMMKRNASRLLRMVEQMLELSRLDTEAAQKYRHYSLKDTLHQLVTAFQPMINHKQLQLKQSSFDDVILLMQVESLELILTNLLSNAIKYTNQGGTIELTVSQSANYVLIVVRDNGIGIAPQNHDLIFNRFTRANESHDENIPGAGIGLALVKELVEFNKGNIQLSSEINQGSTFTVTLPVCRDKNIKLKTHGRLSSTTQNEINALTERAFVRTSDTEQPDDAGNKPSILLIDDSEDMLQLLDDTLRPFYHTTKVNNGKTAIELAKSLVPDLIISDIMMPGMDGYEVAEQLKQAELTCHIPLIFLTAKSDLDSRLEGWKRDIDDYLDKPFHPEELLLRIEALLSIRALLKKQLLSQLENPRPPSEQLTQNSALNEKDLNFIERFRKVLEKQHPDHLFNRVICASLMHVSERQLSRKLKALFGEGFSELLRDYRLEQATEELKKGQPISRISETVGFSNFAYFSKCYKAKFGKTPSQMQKQLMQSTA